MLILFKNARILTMESANIIVGDLLVCDNRIKRIDKNIDVDADITIECDGNLIMPGFKNAHAHTPMVFARSIADNATLHDWLFDHIFPLEAKFEPNDIYTLMKGGIIEYLSSGITAAFDMYFYPPEIMKAASEFGFRDVILATSDKEPISFLEKCFIDLNKNKDSLISYKLGIHAEYTTSLERIKEVTSLAKKFNAPLYLHIGETKDEVEGCKHRYGLPPLEFLANLGFFDGGGAGFHCNYFTDKEIEICKSKNISIVSCPASNLKLASGIAPLNKYLKNGLNIALGTDGAASNNSLDMFKEMYLASTLQKVTNNDPTLLPGFEVLKMATVNAAKVMGLNDADILKEGKLADIIMIDLKKPSMQPLNNIIDNIVYAGSKDIIKMTMINGKILYMDGEFFLPESSDTIYKNVQAVTDRLKGV